jgi:hypothetical protein
MLCHCVIISARRCRNALLGKGSTAFGRASSCRNSRRECRMALWLSHAFILATTTRSTFLRLNKTKILCLRWDQRESLAAALRLPLKPCRPQPRRSLRPSDLRGHLSQATGRAADQVGCLVPSASDRPTAPVSTSLAVGNPDRLSRPGSQLRGDLPGTADSLSRKKGSGAVWLFRLLTPFSA